VRRHVSTEVIGLIVAVTLVIWSLGGPAGFFELGPWAATCQAEADGACPRWLFWIRAVWPYPPAPGVKCRWQQSISEREGYIGPVKTGVFLGSADLSGWERPQVEELLNHLALSLNYGPQDATYDPVHNKVVPSLNGVRLDTSATLDALFAAPPDSVVAPSFTQQPAEVTREAYPKAIVYHGNPRKNQVSIIINVAWDGEYLSYLRAMLDILDEASVKTTFFVAGKWVENNSELARQIAARGHELANHGYSDAYPAEQSSGQLQSEIRLTTAAIQRVVDQPVTYYSPFYGEYTETVVETAAELGYVVVRWSSW